MVSGERERGATVAGGSIRVGNVEIMLLTDVDCVMPFPLAPTTAGRWTS